MKTLITRTVTVCTFLLFFFGTLSAQGNQCDEDGLNPSTGEPCVNTITTAVPYLRLTPDARSSGMGDIKLPSTPDVNAIYYNSSKLAFIDRKYGLSVSYMPWLKNLDLDNVWMGNLSGYARVDKLQTLGFSVRRFSLGTFFANQGGQAQEHKAFETDFAVSYNRLLGERFAGGLTLRYIYSKISEGQFVGEMINPGTSIAGDISFTYKTPLSDFTELTLGGAITNLGSKIRYVESVGKDYLPTNLGIGGNVRFILGDDFWINTALDINRLLVPTPPGGNPFSTENNNSGNPNIPDYRERSVIAAAFLSFADAPGGFGEEMRENTYSLGGEIFFKYASLRVGYFHEHETKGTRRYLTYGFGLNYNKYVAIDFSYLNTLNKDEPSPKTYHISVLVNFLDPEQ